MALSQPLYLGKTRFQMENNFITKFWVNTVEEKNKTVPMRLVLVFSDDMSIELCFR